MKIWVIEIGEPLPLEKDVRLHRYGMFTPFLAKDGFDVTWWTNSFSHAPKKHLVERDTELMWEGVRLRIIRGLGYSRNVSLARIKHNKHFASRFAEEAPKQEKPDLIIAPIPIIEAAVEIMKYAKPRGIPVMMDIRDEWPEELRNLAPKPMRWLSRIMLSRAYKNMGWVCRQATGIMSISERTVEFGLRFAGRPRGPTDFVFPLGYSLALPSVEKVTEARQWLLSKGVTPGIFTVCFFGTIGKFFDFKTVIDAVVELSGEVPIQLLIGGQGGEFERVKKWANNHPSIFLLGWLDAPKIHAAMQLSHVGLANYKTGTAMSLPNKPFEYMAGSLAILSSIDGELAQLLDAYHCGLSYKSDDKETLKAQLYKLSNDLGATRELGANGHRLLLDRFETNKVFKQVVANLKRVIEAPPKRLDPRYEANVDIKL